MSLFQKSVLTTFSHDESKVALRWAAYQNLLAKVDAIKGFKEEEYQDGFFKDIFENCLGYTLKTTNPSNFNLEREKKNKTDNNLDYKIKLKKNIETIEKRVVEYDQEIDAMIYELYSFSEDEIKIVEGRA